MVNFVDVPKVSALVAERAQIEMALKIIDFGGRITTFVVTTETIPVYSATIQSSHIGYPAHMTDTIKLAIAARANAILQELEGMGMTGTPPQVPDITPQEDVQSEPPPEESKKRRR
jgi:hypothetical protein